jgi:hypothetical protein
MGFPSDLPLHDISVKRSGWEMWSSPPWHISKGKWVRDVFLRRYTYTIWLKWHLSSTSLYWYVMEGKITSLIHFSLLICHGGEDHISHPLVLTNTFLQTNNFWGYFVQIQTDWTPSFGCVLVYIHHYKLSNCRNWPDILPGKISGVNIN